MSMQQEDHTSQRKYVGGLSTKLLLLTILFVMLSEVFVFIPSAAKFRNDWLTDRLTRAETALILIEGAGQGKLSQETIHEALRSLDAVALARRVGGSRQLIGMMEMPPPVAKTFNVQDISVTRSIIDAVGTFFNTSERTILVTGQHDDDNQMIEIVVHEAPLREAMRIYTRNVLFISLFISIATASLVYASLNRAFVRPIRKVADNMMAFSSNPENANNIIKPSGRRDEIGLTEDRLAAMQTELQGTLHQQKRLADLGLAVSKINHDLRNILSSVQLFSDRLTMVPDPNVQRLAPKLIAGIDRAIAYCQSTLVYGSAKEQMPTHTCVNLHTIASDVGSMLDLQDHKTIEWQNHVPENMTLHADSEQIFRVLMNLCRNAVKAMELIDSTHKNIISISAQNKNGEAEIIVQDTGPGIPAKAQAHLFDAFMGSATKGGSGLGLAIAKEIIIAHNGTIELLDPKKTKNKGAAFKITIPNTEH